MKFGPCPLGDCEGAVLAHGVRLSDGRLAKGTILSPVDLAAAAAAGIDELVVARPGSDDVREDDAAARLATHIMGGGLTLDGPMHGRANVCAAADGIVRLDTADVNAANIVDEAITLGTLQPYERVAADDVVATIKIIPFAVRKESVAGVARAVLPKILSIAPFTPRRVHLVQTTNGGTSAKMLAKTERVTRQRVEALGGTQVASECAHEESALAAQLESIDADFLLIAGAAAISDRRDVVPAALTAVGGEIERLGMPVDPGNLLMLGSLKGRPVIGLPGCARSPKRNGFDMVLERLFAGLEVEGGDIAAMGVGGVLADTARPEPRRAPPRKTIQTVGIVMLAAGRSSRMGANKLHEDLGGQPLLLRTLGIARAAGLPVIVVTGHEAARTAALLPEGATSVHAEDHGDGLGASLAVGIAAVPKAWDAAIVMLADMPLIEPELLRALVDAADAQSSIIVPRFDGRSGNPVLWGRSHFAALMRIEGDVGGKAILADRRADIVHVDAPSDTIFLDADTPEALAAIRRRFTLSETRG
ncbi:MAG: molybdopterin-binding/glycosyltransferase family 2 protein [Pacificimonas sp.]